MVSVPWIPVALQVEESEGDQRVCGRASLCSVPPLDSFRLGRACLLGSGKWITVHLQAWCALIILGVHMITYLA